MEEELVFGIIIAKPLLPSEAHFYFSFSRKARCMAEIHGKMGKMYTSGDQEGLVQFAALSSEGSPEAGLHPFLVTVGRQHACCL